MKISKTRSNSTYKKNIITIVLIISLLFNTYLLTGAVNGIVEKDNEKVTLKQDIVKESFEIYNNDQTRLNNIYNEIKMEDSEHIANNLLTAEQKIVADAVKNSQKSNDINSSLSFSLLFGGSSFDYGYAVAVDSSNNIILTGYTHSSDFPILNAYDSSFNGYSDVFLAKFNSTGSLIWSTYLGGNDHDYCYTIAVDSSDNIILTGSTEFNTFPILNAYDSTHNGSNDVFITKFSSSGSLLWSTYLGGSNYDSGLAIAIDSSNNIIVTGSTESSDFPTFDAYDSTYNAYLDVYITKFSSNGSLLWSTYLGGNDHDRGSTVVIDSFDNIILAGSTESSDFPIFDAYNSTHNGSFDVFVTKFTSSGTLLWSTYLGGSNIDQSESIAVDSSDNIILTGSTHSSDFPILNAYDSSHNGYSDVFVTKFSSVGSLLWSTYLGGSGHERGLAVIVDSSENIIVTGYTESSNFPTFNALQQTARGYADCFFSNISFSGFLISSTFIGGSEYDSSEDLTIDKDGNLIMIGYTHSFSDFPLTTDDLYSSTSYYPCCFLIKFTSLALPIQQLNEDYDIQFSNLLGGNSGSSSANGVIIDHSGNTIVIGETWCSDFPTVIAYDSTYNGDSDVFVTKFSSAGSLLWSTYLGGSEIDYGEAIAVDSSDNIILTGITESSDFPTLYAYDSTFSGHSDVFVTKFSSNGSLLWSTYLGGNGTDYGEAIAVDSSNNIILTGTTSSSDFPTLNAYDSTHNIAFDVFVTKFSSVGSLLWSTFLGGKFFDYGEAVTIDSSDNIIVTGYTYSIDFPTFDAYDSTHNDRIDVFVTKFSSVGSLLWSTFLGGSDLDLGYAVTIDSSDNIILTGVTCSSDFPTLNAYDSNLNGDSDAFVTKFTSSGSLLWSNYLGESGYDIGTCIIINSLDEIFIAGNTFSLSTGNWDCYFTRYHSNGKLLDVNIFGSSTDYKCNSLAYNPFSDEISLVGYVASSNSFLGREYPNLSSYSSSSDNAFVLSISKSLSYNNPSNGISSLFQTILIISMVIILVILCIFGSFASYKVFHRSSFFVIFNKKNNLLNSGKHKTESLQGIIEEAKNLADIADHTIEINSPLWNIAKEYNNFEQKKGLLKFKKFSTEGLDKVILDLPSSFASNDEKILIALSKVILKGREHLFLAYLNTKIYDRITKGSFTLLITDYNFMVKSWSLSAFSVVNQKKDQIGLQLTDEHHQLLGSLITELETLPRLQWEFLPFIANIFDNLLLISTENNNRDFYIEKVLTPLSLVFKIAFSENIY